MAPPGVGRRPMRTLRNVGSCGRGPEGLQLMRNPLGRNQYRSTVIGARDMPLPDELQSSLTTVELSHAGDVIAVWIPQQGLRVEQTEADSIPSFQVYIPIGKVAHPILSLQPHPHNPDIPFQKFRAMPRNPLKNVGARRAWVEKLNGLLPASEQKDVPPAADKNVQNTLAIVFRRSTRPCNHAVSRFSSGSDPAWLTRARQS